MNAGELKFSAYFKKIHWFYIKHKGYGRCQMACVCRLARFLCFREMFLLYWNLVINLNNKPLFKGLKSIFILESFKISLFVKIIAFSHVCEVSRQLNYILKCPSLSLDYQFIIFFSVINLLEQYSKLLNRVSNR